MSREVNSPDVFHEIDENLRRAYQEMLNEDLPERFILLIPRLRGRSPEFEASAIDGDC